ncbi:TetR/AcrR family transcriptional regulator [Paraburkholderia sp.]|uniref:TetR/AcrR family transcriptional regulator n=1 Tax=Paraburkholderia sp. TaxID=1926495 RepID=UPI0023A4B99A|nr:TetR/AcrR family transcriptional regulator [Paraburkholderia sp.]MDE1179367.1 TetR/AcrR family transcriptional regulator [Paraburkholderia sp.]
MRKSRAETAETRQRIVEVAAHAFRAKGIQATGLADVMADAGLSHGGFYRHFDSKDQLVAEACATAVSGMIGSLEASSGGDNGVEGLKAVIDTYLSLEHRDGWASGCPLAGMGSELVRADEQTRNVASRGFDELVQVLEKRIEDRPGRAVQSDAVFAVAAMIGAVTISRIITDPDASAAVLKAVRDHLQTI